MKDFKVISLTKTYGVKTLFKNISFTIREGEHIGLIGKNGTGKSSLLSILAKKDVADSGEIECANHYTIGYLSQNPNLNEEDTVFDAVYNGQSPLLHIVKCYEKALQKLNEDSTNQAYQQAFQKWEAQMTNENAWDYDVKIKTILTKLGIHQLNQQIKSLSGGQKKRVGIAQVLIQNPDLLILDEPTNHLDYESILWLEEYLKVYTGALLLVTHDRYFLENVVSKIIELDNSDVKTYLGNYESYLEQKATYLSIQEKIADKQNKLYQSELSWIRRGAQARTTKQKARIERFETLEKVVKTKHDKTDMNLDVDSTRLGKRVFELEQVSLSIANQQVLHHFTYIIQNRDRIGILGNNGVGKSTILNALSGEIPFVSGVFKIGQTVKIGYYKQESEDLPLNKRVVQYLQEVAEEVEVKDGVKVSVTELLEQFLFPRYMHGELISSLSGGERKRLYLLKILLEKPNVLLLDEPTNDLDIATLQVLENYLETFAGAVIVVSHDRYFLDRVCPKLLYLKGNGECMSYLGLASDILKNITTEKEVKSISKTVKVSNQTPIKKMSYHEKKEWENIEVDIEQLEQEIKNVQQEMQEKASDFSQLQHLQVILDDLESQLLFKMERWEYLSELSNQ